MSSEINTIVFDAYVYEFYGMTLYDCVDTWLKEHPEATTTVEDGAVTTPKVADKAITLAKFADDIVDATLTQTGHPADAKATGDAIAADRTRLTTVEGEADALDARITSLATLTEGSTTGDAELIDARTVGAKTYASLHQAIDTEFANVNSALINVDLVDLIAGGDRKNHTNAGVTFSWNSDKTACTCNGTVSGNTPAAQYFKGSTTTMLKGVTAGKTYTVKAYTSDTNAYLGIYFYNNGTYITARTVTNERKITIPTNATGMLVFIGVAVGATVTNATVSEFSLYKADSVDLNYLYKVGCLFPKNSEIISYH